MIPKLYSLASQEGGFEPQRQNHWLITFLGLPFPGKETLELALKTGFLPNESNEEVEIPYMNTKVFVAGKYNVDAGSISFVDYVDMNTANIIKMWRKLIYDPSTGRMGYARSYKKTAKVQLYAPDMMLVREWTLKGIWPQTANFGTLDYSSSDVVLVECTFRYDRPYDSLIPSVDAL